MSRTATAAMAAAGVLVLTFATGAAAADQPYALSGHSQEALWHEFGGFWSNMKPISIEKFEDVTEPLTPAWQAKKMEAIHLRAQGKQVFTSDAQCIPAGMPRMMLNSSFEIISRPNSLGFVHSGGGMQIRNIWLDGRKPTPDDDLFDTFSGESIGHWEGDTLVVETRGLRETNEILYGVKGHKMTVSERFRKTGPDTMEVVMTVTDPVVFTKPWVFTSNYKRDVTKTLAETNYCVAALDREVDKNGKEIFNLTPPPDPLETAKK